MRFISNGKLLQCRFAFGRKREHLGGWNGYGSIRGFGKLFQNQAGVGAADSEIVDHGPPHLLGRDPRLGGIGDIKGAFFDIHLRIRFQEMNRGRNRFMFQRQNRFNQAGHAGSRFKVSDIRFNGPQPANPLLSGALSEYLGQRLDFHRISQFGSGAVGLYIFNRIRIHLGHHHGLG